MIAGAVSMACALLMGAGLMIQAMRNLARVDVGYDPNGLISMSLVPPAGKNYNSEAARSLISRVQEVARSVPGYQASALAVTFAVGGNGTLGPVVIPGRSNHPRLRWCRHECYSRLFRDHADSDQVRADVFDGSR